MVSWEATLAHPLPGDLLRRDDAPTGPRADFCRAVSEHAERYVREVLHHSDLLIPDPLAMALEPSIVLRAHRRAVTVELVGIHTRGQTVVDWGGVTEKPAQVDVVEVVDPDRLREMVRGALA
ncbi:MAG: nucleoside hydrolase [Candidatus Limnocylindria bacterium]